MESDDDWVFYCVVAMMKQQVGSIALQMLFCTFWVCSVFRVACETQEDRDFVAYIAQSDKLIQSIDRAAV